MLKNETDITTEEIEKTSFLFPETNLTVNDLRNGKTSQPPSKVASKESTFIKFIESNVFIPFVDDDNDSIESLKYTQPSEEHSEERDQPHVIFDARKHVVPQKTIGNKLTKKNINHKRITTFRNIFFKYKTPKHRMEKNFNTQYKNRYRQTKSDANYMLNFDSNLSQVTKPRGLKKVFAKENLLSNSSLCSNQSLLKRNDTISSKSATSTESSFLSASSDRTLIDNNTKIASAASLNKAELLPSEAPFKTDIINVAIAVGCTKTRTIIPSFISKEEIDYIKSDETIILPNVPLTSEVLEIVANKDVSKDERSQLKVDSVNVFKGVCDKPSFTVSMESSDAYVIARTSSDFNNSMASENIEDLSNSKTESSESSQCTLNRNEIVADLDTVINIGFLPDNEACTIKNNYKTNVTIDLKEDTFDNKSDIDVNKDKTNVLKKNVVIEDILPKKIINLPDDNLIKTQLKEERTKRLPKDLKSYTPQNLGDIWSTLVVVIDQAIKRLEDTIYKKFEEWKDYLNSFEFNKKETENKTKFEPETSAPGISRNLDETEPKIDVCETVQCNLIENAIIDKLTLKLGTSKKSDNSFKRLRSTFRDCFEVIKSPVSRVDGIVNDREVYENIKRCNRLRAAFDVPFQFCKQNVFVLASVPMFFLGMFCVYGLFIFLLNP